MSGILDNKSRVIDTIITTEGRRQLALGGIDIRYVSFSDGLTFYKADVASGSQDATQRLYLESCQLPQDDIVFQADDASNLMPFRNSNGVQVTGGRILEYTFTAATSSVITGSTQDVTQLQGDAFGATVDALLASSLDNLSKLRLVASKDTIFEEDGFGLGPSNITFTVSNDRPIRDPRQHVAHASSLSSIFADPSFSHVPNFKYLPPVNKVPDRSLDRSDPGVMKPYSLGYYTPFRQTQELDYKQIASELQYYERLGFMRTINFDPTSRDNQLVGQFFEKNYDSVKKLDVIDLGVLRTGDPASPVSHVFFVGKVVTDDNGTSTFLHLFSLVFG